MWKMRVCIGQEMMKISEIGRTKCGRRLAKRCCRHLQMPGFGYKGFHGFSSNEHLFPLGGINANKTPDIAAFACWSDFGALSRLKSEISLICSGIALRAEITDFHFS